MKKLSYLQKGMVMGCITGLLLFTLSIFLFGELACGYNLYSRSCSSLQEYINGYMYDSTHGAPENVYVSLGLLAGSIIMGLGVGFIIDKLKNKGNPNR